MHIAYAAEKRTGSCAAAIGVAKTPTLHVHAGSREALPHKKRTTVLWPLRGRRELRQRCWSLFDGSCRSRTARTWYASCSCPGVSTPARFDGRIGQDYKTQNEFNGGRTQGGEQRDQGRGRHGLRNSAGTRRVEHGARAWSARRLFRHSYAALQEKARRSLQGRSSRFPPTTQPRETAWRQRGVFTSGFPPSRGGPRPSASPFSQT